MFAILPIYHSSYFAGGRFSMFHASIFRVFPVAGVGMIFMILGILIFLLRFASSVIDLNKIIKIKINFEFVLQAAFLLLNLFVLFIAFIAAIISPRLTLFVWWYISVLCTLGGLALSCLPDLIKWPKE
jgi:hypothetical protein